MDGSWVIITCPISTLKDRDWSGIPCNFLHLSFRLSLFLMYTICNAFASTTLSMQHLTITWIEALQWVKAMKILRDFLQPSKVRVLNDKRSLKFVHSSWSSKQRDKSKCITVFSAGHGCVNQDSAFELIQCKNLPLEWLPLQNSQGFYT